MVFYNNSLLTEANINDNPAVSVYLSNIIRPLENGNMLQITLITRHIRIREVQILMTRLSSFETECMMLEKE